jgi:hypothetical protein
LVENGVGFGVKSVGGVGVCRRWFERRIEEDWGEKGVGTGKWDAVWS